MKWQLKNIVPKRREYLDINVTFMKNSAVRDEFAAVNFNKAFDENFVVIFSINHLINAHRINDINIYLFPHVPVMRWFQFSINIIIWNFRHASILNIIEPLEIASSNR